MEFRNNGPTNALQIRAHGTHMGLIELMIQVQAWARERKMPEPRYSIKGSGVSDTIIINMGVADEQTAVELKLTFMEFDTNV